MNEYISKQVVVHKSDQALFDALSNFHNLTPYIGDKMEGWTATEDSCTFNVQGFNMCLRIQEKEAPSVIKLGGDEGSPVDFNFWIQLKATGPDETRLRLVLHVKLNMMLKMMIGNKLQKGIDQMAEHMALALSNMKDDGVAMK